MMRHQVLAYVHASVASRFVFQGGERQLAERVIVPCRACDFFFHVFLTVSGAVRRSSRLRRTNGAPMSRVAA